MPTYEGLYSGLEFFGFATPSGASNGIAKACPGAPCTASSPLGAGLGVRFGYSFGWIAVEGMALGSYDYSTAGDSAGDGSTTDPARTESYTFHRFGGGAAVGARFATQASRTCGSRGSPLGGFATMGNIYKQDASRQRHGAALGRPSRTTTYTAPLLMAGRGRARRVGQRREAARALLTMLQFVGGAVTRPGPRDDAPRDRRLLHHAAAAGRPGDVQVFVGPMIGFDFGL